MPIPGTAPFGSDTLPQALAAVARRRPDALFLTSIDPAAPDAPPRRLTFAGFERQVRHAAAALAAAGVGRSDRVLLLAENSPAWQALSLGAQALGAEPAALFAQLGGEAAADIARRVRPRAIVVSGAPQWTKLAPAAGELARTGLAAVFTASPLAPAELPAGVAQRPVDDVVERGPELPAPDWAHLVAAGSGDDPFLLLFTSGTTGRPKGVRLPQRAILHAIEGGRAATAVTEDDLGLHFLPFGHVAGHDQFMLALAQGHGLVMVARREDLPRGLALRPTYLFSVPLLYERMRDEVQARLARVPGPLRGLARPLAARALRRKLGGRVRGLFSGGAATPPGLAEFFEQLGLPFVELYGMSETAGLISSNLFRGPRTPGSAGHLSSHLEARVGPDGELCVRGGTLMTGYLDAEDAAGAYTDDGFFRTGDLARLEPDGQLRIEGRRKSLLVLSTGKKVSPEPIEAALAAVAPGAGAVLLGDGRPYVAALLFVPAVELTRIAAAHGDAEAELLRRARAATTDLSEYERPKRLLVVPGAPADHPGLLTPTLKLRRDVALAAHRDAIDRLYAIRAAGAG